MNRTSYIGCCALLALASHAHAATIQFAGELVFVLDFGTGTLAQTMPGEMVSGQITYGNSRADARFSGGDNEEASYWFIDPSYGATIHANGNQYTDSGQIRMDVVNDAPQSGGGAAVFNGLFGQSSQFDVGVPYDDWGINAWPTGATVDPGGGGNADDDYYVGGGVFIAVAARSFDESLYDGTDYARFPPALGDPVYGQFRIVERDAVGNLLYDGTGFLTALTPVPLPPAILLLLPGLLSLMKQRISTKPESRVL